MSDYHQARIYLLQKSYTLVILHSPLELMKEFLMKYGHCKHGPLFILCLHVNSDFIIAEREREIFFKSRWFKCYKISFYYF